MDNEKAIIPANFTDAGKLLGLFEIRNAIECAIICIPLIFLIISFSPFGLTGTLITSGVLIIPTGGFALMGIKDHSLFTFLRLYFMWRKRRGILIYRGEKVRKKGKNKNEFT